MDMCYDGTLSTAFGLSSWLFTEGENMVECILDLIQKRKNSLGIW